MLDTVIVLWRIPLFNRVYTTVLEKQGFKLVCGLKAEKNE